MVDQVNAVSFTKCHNDRTEGHLLKLTGCQLGTQLKSTFSLSLQYS